MKKHLIGLLLTLSLVSCNQKTNSDSLNNAFYYWKSNPSDLNDDQLQANLKQTNVSKIYVKLFEVDYLETVGNTPIDKINHLNKDFYQSNAIEIVPTIFINNNIFQYNTKQSLNTLADNIVFLINKRFQESISYTDNTKSLEFKEIQIDCDWTKSTQKDYFYLLEQIKLKAKKNNQLYIKVIRL